MRMALAEAGYPDAQVTEDRDGVWVTTERSGVRCLPLRIVWRAFTTVDPAETVCWQCYEARTHDLCLALGARSEDCGVSRDGR